MLYSLYLHNFTACDSIDDDMISLTIVLLTSMLSPEMTIEEAVFEAVFETSLESASGVENSLCFILDETLLLEWNEEWDVEWRML